MIEMIYSSSYQPDHKVEIGHRIFPTQAKYDLVQLIGHDAIPASEY